MLKTALIVVVLMVAALLGFAALRPDEFRVERAMVIQAPPEKIHPLIADFRRWPEWSPWEKRDPAMKRTLGGAEKGRGATYAWDGNSDVGSGRMEIQESAAPSTVVIRLDFLKPFEAHNITRFQLAPKDGGTEVRWTMSGPQPYMAKLMSIFLSMDTMVGGDFEAGLANLKAAAERS